MNGQVVQGKMAAEHPASSEQQHSDGEKSTGNAVGLRTDEQGERAVENELGLAGVGIVMQTWDAITSRRNVRVFADRPVPAADLDQILEAGRRSPSSQNWQPWDFILVTDRQQLRELAKVWRGAGHVAGSAAAIVVIGPAADNEFHRAQLDLGQATMAMTLAAADLGIGSCHAGVADLELARELLGFPEDRNWAFLISLGYPADRPLVPIKNPKRRPFAEVVHRSRW
ncbi:MAG TPA: nitroreductase family protein [Streptosporangiaceae bacterium]|nr:nitroreductase family protein [Streptosporangiaceae bacterium]